MFAILMPNQRPPIRSEERRGKRRRTRTRLSCAIVLGFWLTLQLAFQTCQSLKVSAQIPELVKLNDPFWLNCSQQQLHQPKLGSQDLPTISKDLDDIYAIKWYKDDEEFYRFLPNGQPKVSIYETNGIQLDQTKSHEGNVYINKADVNSEGNYKCEILSEAPVFETVRKLKHLKVYALPVRGPRIEILDSQGRPKSPKGQEISYNVGDKIELRCNSAPSKPAAKLRWYLNEHEIPIPSSAGWNQTGGQQQPTTTQAGYEVRATPMEFRQHYKSIYSSHSSLSLVLQQDDLINNKISFKCLASMRQEIQLRGKQLVVLMAPLGSTAASPLAGRDRRAMQISPATDSMVALSAGLSSAATSSSSSSSNQRQRPQSQRHSVARLQQQQQQQQQPDGRHRLISGGNSPQFDDNEHPNLAPPNEMLYIYEEANSALGSTIIDTLEALESYLGAAAQLSADHPEANSVSGPKRGQPSGSESAANYGADSGRPDNVEQIQLLRERNPAGARHRGQAAAKQRANSLVRSPLYLDETDPLRPIISWPPLESGKLQLLAGGHSIVASPLLAEPFVGGPSKVAAESADEQQQQQQQQLNIRRIMLDKLLRNMNCTCTDASMDTRLGWLLNDDLLDTKDTKLYPARLAPDHRQTSLTVGLLGASSHTLDSPPNRLAPASSPGSRALKSLLAAYLSSPATSRSRADQPAQGAAAASNNQIRFSCQTIHPMLLHSSSEMITFDFNPPPSDQVANSIVDKFAASPSNVIQATSASQSSSGSSLNATTTQLGSQAIIFLTLLATLFCLSSSALVVVRKPKPKRAGPSAQ